jgi:MFS family permease
MGVGLIAFGLSRWMALSLPMLALMGFGQMVQMAGSNTLLQTLVDDDKRGRVMSFYTIAFMGTAPFGNLLAGWLARHIGAPATVAISGTACILAAVAFLTRLEGLREHIRPIYVRMGIISDTPPIPREAVEQDINDVDRGA